MTPPAPAQDRPVPGTPVVQMVIPMRGVLRSRVTRQSSKLPHISPGIYGCWAALLIALSGCGGPPQGEADAQAGPLNGDRGGPTAVDVAIARPGSLQEALEYTGTTQPVQQVSLRARVQGQLLSLNVDVGDAVTQGQILARLDGAQLVAAVNEAQAELAARESEVANAQTQVSSAQTQVEQARLTLIQAQADAARSQQLVRQGAIAKQLAQLDQTEARTAAQALRSAQVQVRSQQQAVAAAQRRVTAQKAVVAQAQAQQSYTTLASPITGAVLERVTDPGNLLQPGSEVLRLGDFSRVKVVVQVSDRALANVRVGQPVQIRLDAFAGQQFNGQVSRISPAADPTARLIPIEITIPNRNGRVGSGLLARASFSQQGSRRVVVPETAFESPEAQGSQSRREDAATLFVVTGEGPQARAAARQVRLGERADGQVEILEGLKPGERFVARSNQPLTDGEPVRLSIISEPRQQRGNVDAGR